MPTTIPGRDARQWQQQLFAAARLDKQATVFFTQDSVLRVQLERHLPELVALIEASDADPLYVSVGFQVLASQVLTARVPLDAGMAQRILDGCDCYEFIAYLRKDLARPVDQAGATAAELAQDACERQLAQAILARYDEDTPRRRELVEQLRRYTLFRA